jgi:hypothetical protein
MLCLNNLEKNTNGEYASDKIKELKKGTDLSIDRVVLVGLHLSHMIS